MLIELKVADLGIIENTHWLLDHGLNVITGETGAGKSLVIDALEILLSGKTGDDVVRHGSREATIEGVFSLPNEEIRAALNKAVSGKGIPIEDNTLVITCTIRLQGRTVFRANGAAVPRSIVQQIGRRLIDIHGQSEHLTLLDRKIHLDLLDRFGGTQELRIQFNEAAERLRSINREVERLTDADNQRSQRQDFLAYQIAEIRSAELQEEEEAELQRQRQILASTEKLQSLSHGIHQTLSDDDARAGSVVDRLHQASRDLFHLADLDDRLADQARSLEEMAYGVEEIARDTLAYADTIEYEPEKLAEIELRLELIQHLKRKYGKSVADILTVCEQMEAEMAELTGSTERLSELETRRAETKSAMGQIASALSNQRVQSAVRLTDMVTQELASLGMSNVNFTVSVQPVTGTDTIALPDGQEHPYADHGIDRVQFLASTNPGEPAKPLDRIASTGETSRFMLALKTALSEADDIPVVVFDEIDIGVGGRSADVLGRKLWCLGQTRQVICITHLPQIASFADAHFTVHKERTDERTTSILRRLESEDRLNELATMLSGPEFSEAALDSARELVNQAGAFRRERKAPQ